MTTKRKNEEGQALVEFAFALSTLLLIATGILEFGITLHHYQEEANAVSVAARLLSSSRGQPAAADPCALVAQAIEGGNGTGGAAPDLNPASLTLTVTLNGNQYTGTTCSAGAANMVYAAPAQVQATYPCSLWLVNLCTLTAQTTEVIQ